jgi:anthranilate phosphoribosyltransferase
MKVKVDFAKLEHLFSENATDQERADWLITINEQGIKPSYLQTLVEFLLPKKFPPLPEAIDVCGTGGSGLPRINTSTISALLLATQGIKVAKHGNRAASGRFGSFDLLEKLGLKIDLNQDQITKVYQKTDLTFIFAQQFFPAMRFFAQVRKDLKVPTIFNLLGPLLNPAQTKVQLIGTNSLINAELIAKAAQLLGKEKVMVVTGSDGLDEVTLTGKTDYYLLQHGKITNGKLTPEDFGLEQVNLEQIIIPKEQNNVNLALEILAGENKSAHTDLILINATLAYSLKTNETNYQAIYHQLKKALTQGQGKQKLQAMIEATNLI